MSGREHDEGRSARRDPRHRSALLALAMLAVVLVSAIVPAPAEGAPPDADAGPDQTVVQREYVTFNGSGSSDDVGIVNYTWTFVYGNNTWTLSGMVNSSFFFFIPGTYNVTLNVSDEEGGFDTDTMVVTVVEAKVNIFVAYWWGFLIAGAVIAVLVVLWLVLYSKVSFVSEPTREKTRMLMGRLKQVSKQVLSHRMGAVGVIILTFFFALAIFGPILAPHSVDPNDASLDNVGLLPSKEYWMGTDSRGVDIFSQLLYGARTSIIVGVFAAIIASAIGAAVGLYSGYVGGWRDEVIMRINDVILAIPWLVLMILLAAMIGEITLTLLILIIGVTGWSGTARLVRAQVMSLRERMYVERARAIGSGNMHIINKHILPNSFPLVFANTILTVAISILSEATLSFLKMRPVGTTTWGTMLSYAQEASALSSGLYWWIIAPGLCIVFLVLGFTLLGHALDEVVNPRLRMR
ncbi:MAG: ABC transporter permease subunit [Thermoplasmata archaeon]